jgi:hypothetical protein
MQLRYYIEFLIALVLTIVMQTQFNGFTSELHRIKGELVDLKD